MTTLRIGLLGDLYGKTGCSLFARHSSKLKKEYDLDAMIVNGENAADGGKGITDKVISFLLTHGASVITTGNHVWAKKEVIPRFSDHEFIVRPANYPDSCPGRGMTFFQCKGYTIGVINLMGRVFMPTIVDSPFEKVEVLLKISKKITPIMFVDMHAETSYEKLSLGYFLDGQVTAVVGTHTHVQTADARLLPQGTAYISDLGMGGALHSMIGAKKEALIERFITQMPTKHEEETMPPYVLSGAVVEFDAHTGKAFSIDPIRIIDNDPLDMKVR